MLQYQLKAARGHEHGQGEMRDGVGLILSMELHNSVGHKPDLKTNVSKIEGALCSC